MSLISNSQSDDILKIPQLQHSPQPQSITLADPINISLQPPTVKRGHRHRRSAAISGDFDSNSFLQPPQNSSINANLSKSLPCSPIKSNINSIANILNSKDPILSTPTPNNQNSNNNNNNQNSNNNNQNYNYNSYSTLSPSHLSTPIKFYLTEEAKFSNSNSNIPDALINLDDITNNNNNINNNNNNNNNDLLSSSLPNLNNSSLNSTILTPTPLTTPKFSKKLSSLYDYDKNINHLPKHSLLCSPKKTDVIIVEEITEENNTFELDTPDINKLSKSNNNKVTNNSDIDDIDIDIDEDEDEDEDDSYENIIPSSTFSNNQFEVNSLLMSKNLNNSLTSLPTKNSNNSSSNSINSNPNPFSNLNTSSISSLKGKVRYQSYYNLAPSTPKSNHHNHYQNYYHNNNNNNNNNLNSNLNNNNSLTPSNYHKLTNSISMSPIKPNIKSPFKYQSLQYELPDDFHQKNNILEDLINEQKDDKELTLTTDIITPQNTTFIVETANIQTPKNFKNKSESTFIIDNNINTNNNKSKNSLKSSSCSTFSNKSNSNLPSSSGINSSKEKNHQRSSSLFSILSKKISNHHHNHHHRRKSSVISNLSKKSNSIIVQTNNELLGLNINNDININNDSTLNEDTTLTPDCIGEPGPMVEIDENDINRLNNNSEKKLINSHNSNNSNNSSNSNNSNVLHNNNNSYNHSNKKGLFSWIVKSKKNRVSSA